MYTFCLSGLTLLGAYFLSGWTNIAECILSVWNKINIAGCIHAVRYELTIATWILNVREGMEVERPDLSGMMG